MVRRKTFHSRIGSFISTFELLEVQEQPERNDRMSKSGSQQRKPASKARSKKHSPAFPLAVSFVAVLAGVAVLFIVFRGQRNPAADTGQGLTARQVDYEVVNIYPHDPTAYL